MTTRKHQDQHEPASSHDKSERILAGVRTDAAHRPGQATSTIRPSAQVQITGRVVDVDGHPLHALPVTAAPRAPLAPDPGDAPPVTNKDGQFALTVARGSIVNVQFPAQCEHDGRVLINRLTTIRCEPYRDVDLGDIVYQPLHSGVTGTVQRVAAGPPAVTTPLPGVSIDLLDARSGNKVGTTTTGNDGTYTFSIPQDGIFRIGAPAGLPASAADGPLVQSGPLPEPFHGSPEYAMRHPPITYGVAPGPVPIPATIGAPTTTPTAMPPTAAAPAAGSRWAAAAPAAGPAAPADEAERHVIKWGVCDTRNAPAPDVYVELCTADGTQALQHQLTDHHGIATFEVAQGGEYVIRVHGDPPAKPVDTPVTCNSMISGFTTVSLRSRAPAGDGSAAAAESLVDMAAYPILTEDVSPGGGATPSRTGADASVGLTASAAISSVLGCRSNPDDPNPTAFLAALKNVFDLKDVEGHVEWTYNQTTSYSVDADLGAITGAQASILKRAQTMVAESCRILPLIQPLRPDADPVDCASILSIVVDELQQIPDALSLPSGPIVEQIDELFRLLGAADAAQSTVPLEGLGGQLQEFRNRYGMERQWVNNVEQEQTLTDFITVVDYVTDLYKSWQSNRDFFSGRGGEPPFLGTQLVTLSRLLSVIGDKVNQVRYVMESLFIPRSELATIQLRFGGKRAPMYFDDLLTWIEKASADAASQMRLNGKDAVMTYARTARLLNSLVGDCYYQRQLALGNTDLPKAFAAPRSVRAIKELGDQLDEIQRQARRVNRRPDPRVTTVIPTLPKPAEVPRTLHLQLYGSGFQKGATVILTPAGGGAPLTAVPTWVNETTLTASITVIPAGSPPAKPQPWSIAVVNPDDGTWNSQPGEQVWA